MNIAEPIIRIEKRLELLLNDFKGLKEDLNKVNQSLDNLNTATEHKKKYRPYTVMEFIKEYPLGSHLLFRPKSRIMEMHRLIDGYNDYKNGNGTLFMCGTRFPMSELYDNYEIFKDGEWKPFGVIKND